MRTSHIVAAFMGVLGAGWLVYGREQPPGYTPPNPATIVAFVGVTCGLLWECALRFAAIIRRLLSR